MHTIGTPLPALHHVGLVVRDAAAAVDAYERRWGLRAGEPHDLEYADATTGGRPTPFAARYVFIDTGASLIELIEPLTPDSTYAPFLDDHGDGVHHLAFLVDDLDERLRAAERELGGDDGILVASVPGHGRFAYVDGAAPGPQVELVDVPVSAVGRR